MTAEEALEAIVAHISDGKLTEAKNPERVVELVKWFLVQEENATIVASWEVLLEGFERMCKHALEESTEETRVEDEAIAGVLRDCIQYMQKPLDTLKQKRTTFQYEGSTLSYPDPHPRKASISKGD